MKKLIRKVKYYHFCIKWLWRNREWEVMWQKFQAIAREAKKVAEEKR